MKFHYTQEARRLYLWQLLGVQRFLNKIRWRLFSLWTRSTNGPSHRYLAAVCVVTSELIFNVAGDVGDLIGWVKHPTRDDEIGY